MNLRTVAALAAILVAATPAAFAQQQAPASGEPAIVEMWMKLYLQQAAQSVGDAARVCGSWREQAARVAKLRDGGSTQEALVERARDALKATPQDSEAAKVVKQFHAQVQEGIIAMAYAPRRPSAAQLVADVRVACVSAGGEALAR